MTVKKTMRVRHRVEGDIGVEIEVEGKRLPFIEDHWRTERDGSLRGEDISEACEYVLREPSSLSKVEEALSYLDEMYTACESTVNDSPRCGVHIHINCQHISMLHLYNFMTLYLIFEELLVRWCGPHREGNLFCLRAQDAEYLLHILAIAAEEKEFRPLFNTDELRYASMNVKALAQYGSLEFRAMRGTRDMGLIKQWAGLLLGMREVAKEFDNPQEIIMATSDGGGLEMFVRSIFSPEEANMLMGMDNWDLAVINGVRRVQEVAYATDWEEFASLGKRKVGGIEVPSTWDDDFPTMDV